MRNDLHEYLISFEIFYLHLFAYETAVQTEMTLAAYVAAV